jgi:hypothetical protein
MRSTLVAKAFLRTSNVTGSSSVSRTGASTAAVRVFIG